jgi:DNA-binding transcriptional LysR family regulator
MKDLDLRDLDAFVAIARTRNFRRAALESRVSVSSLSQRLRSMEERLGVRLMNRTTRSVALTEAGELLLARVAPAIHDVSGALEEVRGLRGVPSGRLRINAPPPAVDLVLAPMLGPFLQAHPRSNSKLSDRADLSTSSMPATTPVSAMASISNRT